MAKTEDILLFCLHFSSQEVMLNNTVRNCKSWQDYAFHVSVVQEKISTKIICSLSTLTIEILRVWQPHSTDGQNAGLNLGNNIWQIEIPILTHWSHSLSDGYPRNGHSHFLIIWNSLGWISQDLDNICVQQKFLMQNPHKSPSIQHSNSRHHLMVNLHWQFTR